MSKCVEDFRVRENRRLSDDLFVLILESAGKLPELSPGQFVQVKIEGSQETFLRRPFSIHDADYSNNTIRLLIQIAGKGTQTLSMLGPGRVLNLVYPLGNSFTLPEHGEKILLAGGGCGMAPLLFLGKYLKSRNYSPDVLLGFRNAGRIAEYEEYSEVGDVFLTTEDGSRGEKGYITDHTVFKNGIYDRIYSCGPDPMIRAVAAHCYEKNIYCEISLENLMACGFGVCLCCVVDTVRGNVCTCTEGPVFNIRDLKWQTSASR